MSYRLFVSFFLAASLCTSLATAQTLRDADEPAEFPPSSYTGKQYVDSRGCVYIRAGIDGNVTWVPRVARSRKIVCGYQPTVIAGRDSVPVIPDPAHASRTTAAAAATPAPSSAPAAARARNVQAAPAPVARIPQPEPPRRVVVQRPAPVIVAPVRVAKPAPRPAAVVAAAPRKVAVKPTVPSHSPKVGERVATPACQHGTPVSTRYSGVQTRRFPVRCGPQAESPTGAIVARRAPVAAVRDVVVAPAAVVITPHTRVAPRHVAEQQRAAAGVGKVPPGYRKAWSDGRLNQHRAHQTLAGKAQMDLIWTQTVPRRLIDRSTGRDVTKQFPKIEYPYRGEKVSTPVVSSTGTRIARKSPEAVSGAARYVQVGTYGVPANARRATARLQQMGFPARLGRFDKGGKSLEIVLAGPFASPEEVGKALGALRRAGYRDAFARR